MGVGDAVVRDVPAVGSQELVGGFQGELGDPLGQGLREDRQPGQAVGVGRLLGLEGEERGEERGQEARGHGGSSISG